MNSFQKTLKMISEAAEKEIDRRLREPTLCNQCGENMNLDFGGRAQGLVDADVSGGYQSEFLTDMTTYCFNLCEKCLRSLFVGFKIPPTIRSNDDWSFQDDQEHFEYWQWKKNGGFHDAYENSKCNRIKDCPNDASFTILNGSQNFSENCTCEEHKEIRLYGGDRLTRFISPKLKAFL